MNSSFCCLTLGPFCGEPPIHSFNYSFNFDVHADPLRTRSSMAVYAAIDIVSLHADVLRSRAAVAPPLGWSKQADDRRACRDCNVRWTGIAANVNTRTPRQRVKTFQRQTHRSRLSGD